MISRRGLLKGVAAAAVTAGHVRTAEAAAARPPNIVLFLADDLRWDVLGAAGDPAAITPHIDRIASAGILFSRSRVTTSICPVSRASIWTGQYARRHGIHDFSKPMTEALFAETFPAALHAAGYHTGFIGKYGIGEAIPAGQFDFLRAFEGQGTYKQPDPNGGWRHLSAVQAEQSLEFLSQRPKDTPFFLQVSFKAPHAEPPDFIYDPADASLFANRTFERFYRRGEEDFSRLAEAFRAENLGRDQWQERFEKLGPDEAIRGYYRLVTGLDRAIGRIMERIEGQGETSNTVVLFTSDNGLMLGEHGLSGKWFGFDTSIRVPLLFADLRQPLREGRRSDVMALNIDVAPTLLTFAGLRAHPRMQGLNLSKAVAAVPILPERGSFFYEHLLDHPRLPRSEGVISGKYKYLHVFSPRVDYEQLFDLDLDPDERRNLAGQIGFADILQALRDMTRRLAVELA
jgi:arylsulfatase A-like enzyme